MGTTQLTRDEPDAGGRVDIEFRPAGAMFFGFYDPETGRVLINDSLEEKSTMSIVMAHELGHAMGLEHVEISQRASVMNPGNTETLPTRADEDALKTVWNGCR